MVSKSCAGKDRYALAAPHELFWERSCNKGLVKEVGLFLESEMLREGSVHSLCVSREPTVSPVPGRELVVWCIMLSVKVLVLAELFLLLVYQWGKQAVAMHRAELGPVGAKQRPRGSHHEECGLFF